MQSQEMDDRPILLTIDDPEVEGELEALAARLGLSMEEALKWALNRIMRDDHEADEGRA